MAEYDIKHRPLLLADEDRVCLPIPSGLTRLRVVRGTTGWFMHGVGMVEAMNQVKCYTGIQDDQEAFASVYGHPQISLGDWPWARDAEALTKLVNYYFEQVEPSKVTCAADIEALYG